MTEARAYPLFYPDIRQRAAYLFDSLTSYVAFPPASTEELEVLAGMMGRLTYPQWVVEQCRK